MGLVLTRATVAHAADVRVAVAANFTAVLERLAGDFERDTHHHVTVVSGATGTLYAQVTHGAPFDVFLAADEQTPARLEAEGLAVAGTRFTYAIGQLALSSATPGLVDGRGDVLRRGAFRHLAVANAKLAPYGAAALEVIDAMGLGDELRPKLVVGENVGQVAQLVASGSAEVGFVALSQVLTPGGVSPGSFWVVPQRLYTPIRQQAVVLSRGAANPAARALVDYLKDARVKSVIVSFGYTAGESAAPPPAPPPSP